MADDVFTSGCLEGLLFEGAEQSEVVLSGDIEDLLSRWNTRWRCFTRRMELNRPLPVGPYHVSGDALYQLYKIRDDPNRAFITAMIPSLGSDEYEEAPLVRKVDANTDDGLDPGRASLPASRLHHVCTRRNLQADPWVGYVLALRIFSMFEA